MTRPIPSANSRPEARFLRARAQQGPLADPMPPLRPLWRDVVLWAVLTASVILLLWWQ